VRDLKGQPNDRAIILGEYILENKSTVRAAAKQFGISKSTVHKDVSERLPKIQPQLFILVKEVLDKNKQERHIRGGLATKKKYEQLAIINHNHKASGSK
jgi:putative DeoR family transcriptional regulator (stage III sporulation protein D)